MEPSFSSDRGGRSIDPGGLDAQATVRQVVLVNFSGSQTAKTAKAGLGLRKVRSLDLVNAEPRGSQWNNRTVARMETLTS